LALINEFEKIGGKGLAAPSANRFGAVSPTSAEAVEEEIGNFLNEDDLILNGNQCYIGIESTIIDCTKASPYILRSGAITKTMIEHICGLEISKNITTLDIRAPGLLGSHYSPKAKIRLDSNAKPGEGFLALAHFSTPSGAVRLSAPETVQEYARDFYKALRLADTKKLNQVVILLPKGDGLAEAIKDRAIKASAGN
jgi:L-threonylcarbamoyladenylate synthase